MDPSPPVAGGRKAPEQQRAPGTRRIVGIGRVAAPAAVALLLAVAAGCGGSPQASTTTTTSGGSGSGSGSSSTSTTAAASGFDTSLDPCKLVTQQQVAQAVGMSVDAGKAGSTTPGLHDCTWTTSAGDAGAGLTTVASVTVEVVGPPPALRSTYPTARRYYDFTKHLYSGSTQDVTGIGDAAFLSHDDHWLYALHGNVLLRVFATGGQSATVGPQVQQLMKEALAQA